MKGIVCKLMLALGLWVVATASLAQSYPAKPIHFIIGFPPGTIIDGSARLVASDIEKRLGQAIVIEFKPGANGTIGAKSVATSAADGYTLCYCNSLGFHPLFNKNNAVDATRDLLPVAHIITAPWIIFSSARLPVNSLRELVAFSKANPSRLTHGAQTANIDLVMQMLKERTGVVSRSIPYKGSPQTIVALIAGEVDLGAGTVLAFLPHVKADKVRALVVAADKRAALLPDVPTATELGIPNFTMSLNYGLWAPPGTPAAVIARLNTEVGTALKNPAIAEKLRLEFGAEPVGGPADAQLRAFEGEVKFWTEAARLANYQPQ